jgi:hypothetical protein
LGGVLVDVSLDCFLVDVVLGDAVLVDAHGSERVECARMDLLTAIRYDANHDLLPPHLTPGSTPVAAAEVADVLHDGVHGSREAELVLVVHGDAYEQLRLTRRPSYVLAQLVASLDEVVRVTGDGRVAHVGELDLVPARQEAVEDGWDLALEDELAID